VRAGMPVRRHEVLAWREGLLLLAGRLEQPAPVNACGVARVLRLLTDGTGPLYNPTPRNSLRETIWLAAEGLDVGDEHDDWAVPEPCASRPFVP
jgi:hypothetical protein